MHPRDLTPVELAELLDAAYRQDRGLTHEGPDPEVRMELAHLLGGHPDVQAEAWAAWQELMAEGGDVDEDKAEYWLHIEFIEPCPQ